MTRTPGGSRAQRLAAVAPTLALFVVGVVLPVLVARHYGALGVPRGDDWSYLRTLFTWVDTGELNFNNWVSMTLLGQLVLAAPVVWLRGRDIAAVQLVVTALGFVGLLAVAAWGRYLDGRRRSGLVLALSLAAGPIYATLAVSFMTDVPGLAASCVAVLGGLYATTAPNRLGRGVAVAFVAGLIGFTIRQYTVIPVVAVAIVACLLARAEGDRGFQRKVLVGAGSVIGLAVLFLAGWSAVPDAKALSPTWPDGHAARALLYEGGGMARLVGLWSLPALLWAGPRALVGRALRAAPVLGVLVGATTGLVLAATARNAPRIAFAGNYVVPDGILADGVSAGPRPDLIPGAWWTLLVALGTVGTALLALLAVPWLVAGARRLLARDVQLRDPVTALLSLTTLGYTATYALAAVVGLPLYDRYVLPIVPLVGASLVRTAHLERVAGHAGVDAPTRRPALAGLVALVVLGAVGALYTVDSASFDGVRWHVASDATRAGWHPKQVGGNFEWINYYSATPGSYARRRARICVVVVLRPDGRGPMLTAPALLDLSGSAIRGTYRPPFRDPVAVVAVRNGRLCWPGLVPVEPAPRPEAGAA